MNISMRSIAEACMNAAYDGSMNFPHIVGQLIESGFEGYLVDYRRHAQTYYVADGKSVTLELPQASGAVAERFDASTIAELVRWAQADGPDYTYQVFSTRAMAAGCAGYIVSFPGRRVVYFGRTAEVHVEHFPQ